MDMLIIILPAIWVLFNSYLVWYQSQQDATSQSLLMTQRRYGTFTRKTPDLQVINGALYHVKTEKFLASNANADINTRKNDQ